MRMDQPTSSKRRIIASRRSAVAMAVAGTLVVGWLAPASAQLFDFGFGRPTPPRSVPQRGGDRGGFFENPFFTPFQQQPPPQQRQQSREDYSRAPPPAKRDGVSEQSILVLGDGMADWLAYGLEDALSETPEFGVVRKHRTVSGLIRYQPRGEPSDWVSAAKGILATEKPAAIVVMLGLHDRTAIREAASDKRVDQKERAKTDDRDTDLPDDQASHTDPNLQIIAPEKSARGAAGGTFDFRDDQWAETYSRKIDEMIAVLKAKGVPVLWVGLPAVRGAKSTADMLYLDQLYRTAAEKAGITYVDVWDGFVDEAGRFLYQGPDFEGQTRRLRTADGVYFTKAGARKLAHYVDRELKRVLGNRVTPVALPSDPVTPDPEAKPGGPAPRPLVGPVVPLVATTTSATELLGGPNARPAPVDSLAAKTMVRGEALTPPPGRADDAVWPRREVGRELARAEPPPPPKEAPAVSSNAGTAGAVAIGDPNGTPAPVKRRSRPVAQQQDDEPGLFGGGSARRAPPPQQREQPRPLGDFFSLWR